jgi:RNA polymerase sigma-70 factor, ECF subfamily
VKEHLEEHLVHRLNKGDQSALREIFDRYYRPLTLFAIKYLEDAEEAKEIVQELFVRIWARHQEVRISYSLKMYLYQSTRNACINHIESQKVKQRRLKDYRSPEIANDHALNLLLESEQEELLMRAIDSLPPRCREIFLLSRTGGLQNQEIAKKLNLSLKTVEAQLSIALKRLSQALISLALFLIPAS